MNKISCIKLIVLLLIITSNLSFSVSAFEKSLITGERERYQNTIKSINNNINNIDDLRNRWEEYFLSRDKKYSLLTSKLDEISNRISNDKEYNSISEDFAYIVNLWRSFADNSFENISGELIRSEIPETLNYPSFSTKDITEEDIIKLKNLNQQYISKSIKYSTDFEIALEHDILKYNKILLYSGKLRSKLYQHPLNHNSFDLFSKSDMSDLWKEIQIIPTRWGAVFYSKLLEFKNNLNMGIEGYFSLLKEIVLFALIIACFLYSFRLQNILNISFDKRIERLKDKTAIFNESWMLHYSLSLLGKLFPWLFIILFIEILELVLEQTSIREAKKLLFYILYYVYYRILIVFTSYTIVKLKTQNIIELQHQCQIKLLRSFLMIYRFILFNAYILYTINAVVGKAVLYRLYLDFFIFLGVLLLIRVSDLWRKEIFRKIKLTFPEDAFKIFRIGFHSICAPLISALGGGIIFIQSLYLFASRFSKNFDFVRKLSAKLFFVQIKQSQSSEETNHLQLPQEYEKQFFCQKVYKNIIRNKKEFQELYSKIDEWIKDDSELHSIAIFGPSGIGKSTFIKTLSDQFRDFNNSILTLDKKITSTEDFLVKLKEVLGGEANVLDSFIKEQKIRQSSKKIVFIDNAHNLFLSHIGGFEAIKELIKIINADIDNIFWCLTFHDHSWSYINKAFNSELGIDSAIELQPWTSEELQHLILESHNKTMYQLSFDKIFETNKKSLKHSISEMKSKFFTILWNKSNGNPYYTVNLWLSLLSFDGDKTLYVGIPSPQFFHSKVEFQEELMFVCAVIARHNFLSFDQIKTVVGYDTNLISKVLKTCQERKIIQKEINDTYTLNYKSIQNTIQNLKRKNYVY